MMFTPPWKPTQLTLDLDRRVEQLFNDLIHKPWGCDVGAGNWQPAIDLIETETAFVIEADLPGVRSEDVEVLVHGRRVTIQGRRQSINVVQTALNVSVERVQGEFSRHFDLSHPIDQTRIESEFENGLFRVRIPKKRHSDIHAD